MTRQGLKPIPILSEDNKLRSILHGLVDRSAGHSFSLRKILTLWAVLSRPPCCTLTGITSDSVETYSAVLTDSEEFSALINICRDRNKQFYHQNWDILNSYCTYVQEIKTVKIYPLVCFVV